MCICAARRARGFNLGTATKLSSYGEPKDGAKDYVDLEYAIRNLLILLTADYTLPKKWFSIHLIFFFIFLQIGVDVDKFLYTVNFYFKK